MELLNLLGVEGLIDRNVIMARLKNKYGMLLKSTCKMFRLNRVILLWLAVQSSRIREAPLQPSPESVA